MGKFTDTKYSKTIDNLVDASKSKLNNPYYKFTDRKPTKVTYYAQNVEKSTLDEASGLYGEHVGKDSPFKFNKINDFIIYGIDKINVDYDSSDFGTEATPIEGDAVILPNTITPRPGDAFAIKYVKETLIFRVNSVSIDTLDSGANFYKIQYKLQDDTIEQIEEQVESDFNFIVTNVGTDFKTVVRNSDYNLIEDLEALVETLITYYENIFFQNNVQTLVYDHDGWKMYDPFMIEFLIRNSVMNYGDKYIFLDHAAAVNKTFAMDYTKTFFHALENPNETLQPSTMATADRIDDPNSLFACRMDYYYMIRYFDNTPYKTRFQIFDNDILDRIRNNKPYEKGNKREIYNLWIAYFNNDKDFIKGDILSMIKSADYMDNLECFYMLGISIFIIERYIKMLLS